MDTYKMRDAIRAEREARNARDQRILDAILSYERPVTVRDVLVGLGYEGPKKSQLNWMLCTLMDLTDRGKLGCQPARERRNKIYALRYEFWVRGSGMNA